MRDYDNLEYYDDIKNTLGNKQHADKIIDKIKGIDSEQAKRAIWELVQNARDIAVPIGEKKSVNITIELYDDCLVFKHDGKCFDYKTLFSLIIQVSSKDKKNEEEEQLTVGQFGTGFCTTHAFGRVITLNGSFQLKDGKYVPLTDFILERQGDSDELAFNINEQIKRLDKLTKQQGSDDLPNTTTSLKYTFADENEKQYAHVAVKYIDEYVPYVFALNNAIQSLEVKIKVGNSEEKEKLLQYETKYTQCSIKNKDNIFNGLFIYTILDSRHPDILRNLLYIDCNNVNLLSEFELDKELLKDAKIILPISLNSENELVAQEIRSHFARVFIFFPLIGSQDIWGTTFMMHSPLFTPATERNGLFLVSEALNVQINQSQNRKIIETMNTIIFSFLERYASQIQDVHHIAKLTFPNDKPLEEPLTDIQKNNLNYYNKQRALWQSTLMKLPIIRHCNIQVPQCIANSAFFAPELFNDSHYADDIYKIVSLFWTNIPLKDNDEYKRWTEVLSKWDNTTGDIEWISLEDIAEELQKHGKKDQLIDEQTLIRFYLYAISVNKDIFGSYELLPNLNGEFRKVEFLKENIVLDPCLLSVANDLGLATSGDIIDRKFMFDFTFDEYTGQILNKALLDKRDEIEEKYQGELRKGNNDTQLLDVIERKAFLKLCSVFPPNSSGIRSELMPHICSYWEQEFTYKELESKGEEHRIRYDDAFLPFLLKDWLINLQSKGQDWNKNNSLLILKIIKCAYRLASLIPLIKEYPSFLNQNYELKKNDDLYYEKEKINEELKNIYNSVFKEEEDEENENIENSGTDYDIKNELLHPDFYFDLSKLIEPEKEKKVKLFFEIAERGKDDSILASVIYSAFEQERKSTDSKSILTERFKAIVLDIIQKIAEESSIENKYWSLLFSSIEKEKAELFLESASDTKQGVIFKIMRQNDETIDAIVSMMEDDNLIESLKEKKNINLLKRLVENPEEMEYLSENLDNLKQIIKDAQEAERTRSEEEAHKKHIKTIGENIQNKILSNLQGYELFNTSDIKDEQGGQDFIIRNNGIPVYYIEVKSRWNSLRSIRLSKRQTERASANQDSYAVITVDLSKRENKEDYFPDFDKFKPFIKVLTSVGDKLELIVPPTGIAEDEIFHIEDYSSTIEQKHFERGCDFDVFIKYLQSRFSL